MEAINYSEFRKNLAKTIDRVNDDHLPILITRQNGKPAVLMSLEDFNAYDETAYLIASPANKKDLDDAVAAINAGVNLVATEWDEEAGAYRIRK